MKHGAYNTVKQNPFRISKQRCSLLGWREFSKSNLVGWFILLEETPLPLPDHLLVAIGVLCRVYLHRFGDIIAPWSICELFYALVWQQVSRCCKEPWGFCSFAVCCRTAALEGWALLSALRTTLQCNVAIFSCQIENWKYFSSSLAGRRLERFP